MELGIWSFSKMKYNWVYPEITLHLKFLLFYPGPKGDKINFKLVSMQKG
jgi:hypothetical protein